MNVRLLRRIQKHILGEPKRYDQREWCTHTFLNATDAPACNTKACIAGWAVILGERLDPANTPASFLNMYAEEKGRELLGLDRKQANRLFSPPSSSAQECFDGGWPSRFINAYLKAATPAGRARAAVRRIDHFIKTRGAE